MYKWLFLVLFCAALNACSKPSSDNTSAMDKVFNSYPVSKLSDDFTSNQGGAVPTAITSDGKLTAFAVGWTQDQGQFPHGIVRQSVNGGNSWSTLDNSSGPYGQGAMDTAVAFDPPSSLYVVQTALNKNNQKVQNIHYTINGGQKWLDLPVFFNSSNTDTVKSIIVGPEGVIYLAGTSEDSKGRKTGFVSSLKNGVVAPVYSAAGDFKQVAVKDDTLYVAGSMVDGSNNELWLVKSGSVTGENWSDLFKTKSGFKGTVNAMIVGHSGQVLVAGVVDNGKSKAWLVEQSLDGKTFSDFDNYSPKHVHTYYPTAIYDMGAVQVVVGGSEGGSVEAKNYGSHWNIRRSLQGQPKWIDLMSFRFSNSPSVPSKAVGVTGTNYNTDLLILGDSYGDDSIHHWRVQKITSGQRPN